MAEGRGKCQSGAFTVGGSSTVLWDVIILKLNGGKKRVSFNSAFQMSGI